jgi:hypothetical protein
VNKNSEEWWMCVDYMDLNRHYPKDPFGLPHIDQIMDDIVGYALLFFLECYLGYHHISLKEEDQEKTLFITPFGAYCYTTMSFGLKNVVATYQWAIQHCLSTQIGCNIEAYMNDVVIKTRSPKTLIENMAETFADLWRFSWKLNPTKCTFGVLSGKLLSSVISHRGIKSSLKQIKVITQMGPCNLLRMF